MNLPPQFFALKSLCTPAFFLMGIGNLSSIFFPLIEDTPACQRREEIVAEGERILEVRAQQQENGSLEFDLAETCLAPALDLQQRPLNILSKIGLGEPGDRVNLEIVGTANDMALYRNLDRS